MFDKNISGSLAFIGSVPGSGSTEKSHTLVYWKKQLSDKKLNKTGNQSEETLLCTCE